MVVSYFFREASWYSRYANCVLVLIFFFISTINIIPDDCCDCSTKKKEEPNKYRLIENENSKNSIPNKDKEIEENEIGDNNTVKDGIPEDINSHNISNHSELLNKVDAITNNDNIKNICNEISIDEKLTDAINEKPIDEKSIEEILSNKGQIKEKPADKKKELIDETNENISKNGWDVYDKEISKLDKNIENENICITKNNPYTKILSCYSINCNYFPYIIKIHKKVEENYKKFTKENIKKNINVKTNILEYALECDVNMSEAINDQDYYETLATIVSNVKINKKANSDNKINIKNCETIAINNSKYINNLDESNNRKKNSTMEVNDNNIKCNIKECLYAKLQSNKLTNNNITNIKKLLDECFPGSDGSKTKQIKLSISECKEILKKYHSICRFHNLMYNVLLKKEVTTYIPACISISNVYKKISDALNSTYATIVNVLNKHSSN